MVKVRKAFVLLSGGVDSTTCLYKAIEEFAPIEAVNAAKSVGLPISRVVEAQIRNEIDAGIEPEDCQKVDWVEAYSVDYGQRHSREMEFAKKTCAKFGIKHQVLDIKGILNGDGVMLTDANVDIVEKSYDDIEGVSPTYVPFRNGTLLAILAAQAQKWVMHEIDMQKACQDENSIGWSGQELLEGMKDSAGIYFGAHSEDAHNWAYPDCTPEFIGSIGNAIYTGTYYTVRVHTPFEWSKKHEIISTGNAMNLDYADTWSCYAGGEKHCGKCPTCLSRKESFILAGVPDPTEYEE